MDGSGSNLTIDFSDASFDNSSENEQPIPGVDNIDVVFPLDDNGETTVGSGDYEKTGYDFSDNRASSSTPAQAIALMPNDSIASAMDEFIFEFDKFYGTSFGMSKSERLEYGDSVMTHAMLFTGVDLKDNKPLKWRVENSWGPDHGEKGFDIMTDPWFDQFMYEVVIHKKHLTKMCLNHSKSTL